MCREWNSSPYIGTHSATTKTRTGKTIQSPTNRQGHIAGGSYCKLAIVSAGARTLRDGYVWYFVLAFANGCGTLLRFLFTGKQREACKQQQAGQKSEIFHWGEKFFG
jgi:hypothetical protein